jgi:hypothetical protein
MVRETKSHREYGNQLPSVTTILSVLRKIGLEQWYMRNSHEFCQNAMKKGKTIGTDTHNAIQAFIETGEMKVDTAWADEVTFALKSFVAFKKDYPDINFKLSEIALTSQHGFNGTIDAPEPPILYDWKTCEKKTDKEISIWDDWKYQTSAYVYLWNEHNPDNIISQVRIVAIAKNTVAYKMAEFGKQEIDECFNEVFLPALKIWCYTNKHAKRNI